MSIPTGGLATFLVVAGLAFGACGSDDGAATATTVVTVPATAAQTTTQQQTTAKAPSQTTRPATTQTATTPATTQKTQTTAPAATPKPAPAKETTAGPCEPIGVGARDGDVDVTYARITQKTNLTCAQASGVVAQWGAQQIGTDKALLPVGWKCTSGNVCRSGKQRVSFVLEQPRDS